MGIILYICGCNTYPFDWVIITLKANTIMLFRQDIKDNFLNLFTKVMENEPLENGNKLNVFVLSISNNQFNYNRLIDELENALIKYALSRQTYNDLVEQEKFGNLSSIARERLRKAESNEGELGELLLYCLLESHLHAPKLLTKLELKTAANDYVKGADGVHILKIDDESYQIVFGESKLDASLSKGINNAFKSIKTMMDNGLDKMRYEIHLINSNLLKESMSDDAAYILRKLLIPTENDEGLNMDYSFGVFLGFGIEFTDSERAKGHTQFREYINSKVKNAVVNQIPKINEYLKQSEFLGYDFYFYVMPFSELKEVRKDIINKLKS